MTALPILGIALIFVALIAWSVVVYLKPERKLIAAPCGLAVLVGLVFLMADRVTEISNPVIGTIKAAAAQAQGDADAIKSLKERMEVLANVTTAKAKSDAQVIDSLRGRMEQVAREATQRLEETNAKLNNVLLTADSLTSYTQTIASKIKPRSITRQQRKEFVDSLKGFPVVSIEIRYPGHDEEAKHFADRLWSACQEAIPESEVKIAPRNVSLGSPRFNSYDDVSLGTIFGPPIGEEEKAQFEKAFRRLVGYHCHAFPLMPSDFRTRKKDAAGEFRIEVHEKNIEIDRH